MATVPTPLPMPRQLHFASLVHREAGCSPGERLFWCSDWAGSWEEGTTGEGGKESLALAEGSCQMALLGRSKHFSAAGRTLRVPRGQRSGHTPCSSLVQGAGGKAEYFLNEGVGLGRRIPQEPSASCARLMGGVGWGKHPPPGGTGPARCPGRHRSAPAPADRPWHPWLSGSGAAHPEDPHLLNKRAPHSRCLRPGEAPPLGAGAFVAGTGPASTLLAPAAAGARRCDEEEAAAPPNSPKLSPTSALRG